MGQQLGLGLAGSSGSLLSLYSLIYLWSAGGQLCSHMSGHLAETMGLLNSGLCSLQFFNSFLCTWPIGKCSWESQRVQSPLRHRLRILLNERSPKACPGAMGWVIDSNSLQEKLCRHTARVWIHKGKDNGHFVTLTTEILCPSCGCRAGPRETPTHVLLPIQLLIFLLLQLGVTH